MKKQFVLTIILSLFIVLLYLTYNVLDRDVIDTDYKIDRMINILYIILMFVFPLITEIYFYIKKKIYHLSYFIVAFFGFIGLYMALAVEYSTLTIIYINIKATSLFIQLLPSTALLVLYMYLVTIINKNDLYDKRKGVILLLEIIWVPILYFVFFFSIWNLG